MRTITVHKLRELEACSGQVEKVLAEWGEKPIPLTLANLKRAAELQLDLGWLAVKILTPSQRAVFDASVPPARVVFEVSVRSAGAVYDVSVTQARAVFEASVRSARAIYDASMARARTIRDASVARAYAIRDASVAQALFDAMKVRKI